jgi:hypothetical protein
MTDANRTMARTLGSAALMAAGASLMLTIGPAPAAAEPLAKPPVASSTIRCEAASSGREASKYAGLSASYAYDKRFVAGPKFEQGELDDHTPQGVVWWEDWKGDQSGEDLLLVSAYGQGFAHVIGLDPASGRTVGTVSIKPRPGDTEQTHAGAIGLNSNWLFVDGPKVKPWHTIRKYSLASLRAAMAARDGEISPAGQDRTVYGGGDSHYRLSYSVR